APLPASAPSPSLSPASPGLGSPQPARPPPSTSTQYPIQSPRRHCFMVIGNIARATSAGNYVCGVRARAGSSSVVVATAIPSHFCTLTDDSIRCRRSLGNRQRGFRERKRYSPRVAECLLRISQIPCSAMTVHVGHVVLSA